MKAPTLLFISSVLAVLSSSGRATNPVPVTPTDEVIRVVQQGCCKALDKYRLEWIILYGYDYPACEAENARRDGDDLEQQSGEIWWDPYC